MCNYLYIWQGEEASDDVVLLVEKKLDNFRGIFVSKDCEIIVVRQGKETDDFWRACTKQASGTKSDFIFDDLYKLSSMMIDRQDKNDDDNHNHSGLDGATEKSPMKKFKPHEEDEAAAVEEEAEKACRTSGTGGGGVVSQKMKDLSIDIPESKLQKSVDDSLEIPKIVTETQAIKFSLPLAAIQPEISPSMRERHPDFCRCFESSVSSEELIQLKRGGNSSDLSVNRSISTSSPDKRDKDEMMITGSSRVDK